MKRFSPIILIVFLAIFTANAQIPVPGKLPEKTIVLNGGTIHIGNGKVIQNGFVVLQNGIIQSVGNQSEFNAASFPKADIRDTKTKHIYPGFINLNNTLGITEIDAVRASNDLRETGDLNPNVRSLIAYNAESKITPTVRSNGILLSQPTPRGRLISGQSSIVQLDAWNWEDAVIKADDGIHITWPKKYNHWGKENKNQEKHITQLESFLKESKSYSELDDNNNRKMEAMRGAFDGTKTVYIHVDEEADILRSVLMTESAGISKLVLVGAAEAYKNIDFIKQHNLSLIIRRVHSLPYREDDAVLSPFDLPAKISNAGIPYALCISGDMEPMNSRNLPFLAGTSVSYGVEYEQAVRSITLEAAKIAGIDNRYGSLEKGKSATLFVSDGDALDMKSNHVIAAFIDGRTLDLSSPQKELYEKYSDKYGIETP